MNNRTSTFVSHCRKKLRSQFQKDKDLCNDFKAMLQSQGISMEAFHDILLNSNSPKKTFKSFQEQFEMFLRGESTDEQEVTASEAIVSESEVDSMHSDDDLPFRNIDRKLQNPSSAKFVEEALQSSWGEMDILDHLVEKAYFDAECGRIFTPSTRKAPILQQ